MGLLGLLGLLDGAVGRRPTGRLAKDLPISCPYSAQSEQTPIVNPEHPAYPPL